MLDHPWLLTDAQLAAEVARCLYCPDKPCQGACPADCAPADFIMAVRGGAPSDFARAAAMIMAANPLGGVCGSVCPDTHCVGSCVRAGLDRPIDIPAIQATIIARARELGVMPCFGRPQAQGQRVAIVGGGPAGVGAAAVLAREGYAVDVLEAASRPGGMAGFIPPFRLNQEVLAADLAFVQALGSVRFLTGRAVGDPPALLREGYDAVIVATGLAEPIRLGVAGEEHALGALSLLQAPERASLGGRCVAVVGGGAVAADCAVTAVRAGAARVEMIALETLAELPLTRAEREAVIAAGVEVTGRTRVTEIVASEGRICGVRLRRVALPPGERFHPGRVADLPGTDHHRPDVDAVVIAIGARARAGEDLPPRVVLAGDVAHGPTTVVEAVAAGKNAARRVLALLGGDGRAAGGPAAERPAGAAPRVKSTVLLRGLDRLPVPLDCDFFGIPLASPLLLSAGPPTDGFEPMRRALEAGWAGGILKTAFHDVPIHIPAGYMFSFSSRTFGNCDNVSGHDLTRVCREVEQLRRLFPDRLIMGSTGGPVSGRDELDAAAWQANTRRLEEAGACGIEYSLSCPQGGDGTRGDIVSQDAQLTATIVEWVLAQGDPEVPKLFKLTAAVTSIVPIVHAIRAALLRYPRARAGITLANTFPALAFRPAPGRPWEEGVLAGMSGEGVAPISYLTLARAVPLGVPISGNAGVMDYRAAAHFLALGCRTVQVCSVVMKYGVGIVRELHSGLSHLLAARGLPSVADLIGCAQPHAITPFEALPGRKGISHLQRERCIRCGLCGNCSYLAITRDEDGFPRIEPTLCIGCSFCVQGCPAGALALRERTAVEAAALREA